MQKIGIFFGTDSGTTRLIAKKIAKKLGAVCAKPLNVNRIHLADFLQYDALILGTPTYAEGALPGLSSGVKGGSWEEFLPQLNGVDLSGKRIALYGLGDQEKYPGHFADALFTLHAALTARGATMLGDWPLDDYQFEHSKAAVAGRFVGLVLDQSSQPLLTEPRIERWLQQIKPALLEV